MSNQDMGGAEQVERGDLVRHWFAGIGRVVSVSGKTAKVQWRKSRGRGTGGAWIHDLRVIEREAKEES